MKNGDSLLLVSTVSNRVVELKITSITKKEISCGDIKLTPGLKLKDKKLAKHWSVHKPTQNLVERLVQSRMSDHLNDLDFSQVGIKELGRILRILGVDTSQFNTITVSIDLC